MKAWMFTSCVCCVGSGLCNELITSLEESYRVYVSNCVWSIHLNNEATWAPVGLSRQRKKVVKSRFRMQSLTPVKTKTYKTSKQLNVYCFSLRKLCHSSWKHQNFWILNVWWDLVKSQQKQTVSITQGVLLLVFTAVVNNKTGNVHTT